MMVCCNVVWDRFVVPSGLLAMTKGGRNRCWFYMYVDVMKQEEEEHCLRLYMGAMTRERRDRCWLFMEAMTKDGTSPWLMRPALQ